MVVKICCNHKKQSIFPPKCTCKERTQRGGILLEGDPSNVCAFMFSSRISWSVQKSLDKRFLNRPCPLIEIFDYNDVLKMVEIRIMYKSIISTWGRISPHCEIQSWGRPHARTRQHLLMILEIYMSTRC